MARDVTQPASEQAPLRMSYAEWQSWLGTAEMHRGEWVDGEVVAFAMPTYLHQAILLWLARLLAEYVERRELGQVGVDGAEMWLRSRNTARLPDLFFVAIANLGQLNAERREGPADLVVEIISNDSVTRDRREKFLEYQRAGIPEYWIIDPRPRRQSVDFYTLDADGYYQPVPPDDAGRLRSRVLPGFWIDPGWLWQDPLPGPYQLIGRIEAEQADPLP
ncbi:MAG: Uma2 family endonuclease [Chloroflexota bacterium]|nr:Uma2 family endonuclease [Chloroflexota bacterium]